MTQAKTQTQTQTDATIGAPVPTSRAVLHLRDLDERIGSVLGTSLWHEITQSQIDAFATATGDRQWIHTNPARAAGGPFGSTIAHGYLTLALGTAMTFEAIEFDGAAMAINYGLDKVRFSAPLPVGSRVRAQVALVSARRRGRQFIEVILELQYEIEGSDDVPCIARTVTLLEPAPPEPASSN